MKKRLFLGLLLICFIMMTSGCGSGGEKIGNKKFGKILDAYLDYYDDEILDQYEECYGKIIINTDGMPMLMVYGFTEDRDEATLFSWSKGKIRSVFTCNDRDAIAVNILSDGLLAVCEDENIVTLYLLDKEPEKIGYIDSKKEKAEITYKGKDITLRSPASREEYREFVNTIYKIQYGSKIKPEETDYEMDIFHFFKYESQDEECFYRSVPLLMLMVLDEESVFDYRDLKCQISALKEEGSMTQEEFIVWNAEFYEKVDMDPCTFEFIKTVISRNPKLLNEFDFSKQNDYQLHEIRTKALEYIITNEKEKWLEDIDVISDMSDEELIEILHRRFEEVDLAALLNQGDESLEPGMIDKNALIFGYVQEKALAGWEKIMQGRHGQDAIKAYRNLVDNLPDQIEEWEKEYEGSDEMMVDAYKYYVEHNIFPEDGVTYYYALCRAGEEMQLCLQIYRQVDQMLDASVESLYVYDKKTSISETELSRYRSWSFWIDEIKGWMGITHFGMDQFQDLFTVIDGKIVYLFEGQYHFAYDRVIFEMSVDGNDKEVSLEEYNRTAVELMGIPLLVEEDGMIEENDDLNSLIKQSEQNSFTDYYDTIDEAYARLLEIEGK